uniref:Uncharacterized protein n=1 Tax=viral metagenome TaxID=1070528 RepID=A0A6C0CW57_9ZZZZ
MKKSIKKLQKHKKHTKKHKKTIKHKDSHHKSRRYSRKYKGGNGDDDEPLKKRVRYNPPNPPTPDEEEKRHIKTFINMVIDIKNNGPMISAISAPETVYALMVKILNLWNYMIQNIRIPRNIDTSRHIIDRLYNDVVIAVPQDLAWDEHENNAQFPIINDRSNAILEELFHYVANISNTNFSDVIIIPDFDYFNAPDRDNPAIVYPPPPPGNNDAEEE